MSEQATRGKAASAQPALGRWVGPIVELQVDSAGNYMKRESHLPQLESGPVAGSHRRVYPPNPIGVIALFVFFIEAIATIPLKWLLEAASPYTRHLVVFIIVFPVLLLVLFFGTLWLRRESLYSPSDFREDANFMRLIAKVETVEIRQKAAQLDPRGDPSDVFALIPDLLARDDFETVLSLGRAFLKVRRYSSSLEVFKRLPGLRLSREQQLQVAAFTAYSLNGLARHGDALSALNSLWTLDQQEAEKFWPALAFAYAHFKLGNQREFLTWIGKAAETVGASDYWEPAINLYPDLRQHLIGRIGLKAEPGT